MAEYKGFGSKLPVVEGGGGVGMKLPPMSQTRIAPSQGWGPGSSKVISSTAAPSRSSFHTRQLAANKPGKRAQIRKMNEDVLREREERRSRIRMGYDD